MRKRRIEITTETEHIFVQGGRGRFTGWCAECGGEVKMVTAEEAAMIGDLGVRAIYKLVEAATLHYLETPERTVRICLTSVLCYLGRPT